MKYFKIILLLLFSLTVKSQTVYKTPSGAKHHLANCRMVNNVSQELTLSDAIESGLAPCKICRPPQSKSANLLSKKEAKGESNTIQCKGMTKAGTRCKHRTSIANGYCFQHNPD
jgi:methylphosphotriester-DNA--protein-cysteine methyltransferase